MRFVLLAVIVATATPTSGDTSASLSTPTTPLMTPVQQPAPTLAPPSPFACPPGRSPRGKVTRKPGAGPSKALSAPRCYPSSYPDQCLPQKPLCAADLAYAKIAWRYFENNYQKTTGLVNAVDKYESTTMWDTASALAGTVAARDLGIISEKEYDDRITLMLATLAQLKLFDGTAPNKAYNARTGEMSNYLNKPSPDGIGFSALDLARLASWLNTLACMSPKHGVSAKRILQGWNYCKIIGEGQMYGAARDEKTKKVIPLQEGRLGYEQYGGKAWAAFGFDQSVSGTYRNKFSEKVTVDGVPIAYDSRDPRKLGAYNYVVTESYALDLMEFGYDRENEQLIQNIYEVQKNRWRRTGVVTAVSEDNLDRSPYFVYNTIFAAGSPWNAITDQGVDQSKYRTVSVKAAFSLATVRPDDEYSAVLMDKIRSAYDPARGWYSGVYESGIGYNKAITANTNGIILQALLYKRRGPMVRACSRCKRMIKLFDEAVDPAVARQRCLPGVPCGACAAR